MSEEIEITGVCPTVDDNSEAEVVKDGDVFCCSACDFSFGSMEKLVRQNANKHFVDQ